ncbi:MAG: pyridoxamine 5'-phosphate oxidase family protein [Deltaproteobacteria bacterium]|nr:pyridoxamine 5'-phosphate oxidase family protein [Deltaproteobacteria bacterium]
MKRQGQIKMTPEEQAEFLAQARTMVLCTIDKDGYPHAVAMAFMVKDGCIYMTSYRKAQKVVNVRRNPKVAVMVESGGQYNELKGLMIRGRCEIIDEPDEVWKIMREIRTFQEGGTPPPASAVVQARAQKRAILKIIPEKVASWDHSKLGAGVY